MWSKHTIVKYRVWVVCGPARPYMESVFCQPDTPENTDFVL